MRKLMHSVVEFTLTGLQEGEDGVATFDGVGVLDQR